MFARTALIAGLVLAAPVALVVGAPPAHAADALDALFSRLTPATPGCVVGIERPGQPQITRAYGMSDLEHDVPVSPGTIFEAGSVSKQFTAAAILTLVNDGKIGLSDDIRKYLPEMPDFGTPVTVDQLLSHTSGLRDWGNEEGIAGWPRTDRVYDLPFILAQASRQHALNYKPGTRWSYTNTGFNLLAIIVQRVSGKSLAEFTHDKLFEPLGMTHTSWRDDFRRIVPGRAAAYERHGNGYEQMMPFENAYGNGGLLTTVGDLLIWNRALSSGKLGPFVTQKLQEPAKLSDGRVLHYARGLFIEEHDGLHEVSHSGSTAGYRAWLGRFPDNGLSVAMLCNGSDVAPQPYAIADLYLPKGAADPAPVAVPALAEWYQDERDGSALHVAKGADGSLSMRGERIQGAPGGVKIGQMALKLLPDGRLEGSSEGDTYILSPKKAWSPGAKELAAVAGRYASAEANAVLVVSLKDGALEIVPGDRPSFARKLLPAYADAFAGDDFTARVKRDAKGNVAGLILSDPRVWSLEFARVPEEEKRHS
ncbi:MAG TPA: serine hydrolase domain-containing protein [Rhizomicrobium sp.]|nr:serine hydrolase domain-containing protein [Rhizomicrobium sp.]